MEPTNQDENHQRITIEQYNKEIDDAVKRVESGQFYTHDEAVEILNKPARKKFIVSTVSKNYAL